MHKVLQLGSKNFLLLSLLSYSSFANEAPKTYEELMGLVLAQQSTGNVKLLDRALQTPSNEFEQKYLMGFGNLAAPSEKFHIISDPYNMMPPKDLRQEAASKLLLSGIIKPEELFRAYEVQGKSVSENPREIASLSSPLLSFFYYQAYKKYEAKKSRDVDLEKAIMSRFKEQSAKAKVEFIDPTRAQVLSNCNDPLSDLSVSLVGLSAVSTDEKNTLDVVTHHFVFPKVGIVKKIMNQVDPKKQCEEKVAELKKALETARQDEKLLLLKANETHFELEPFQRFNTGEFLQSCRESFGRLWTRLKNIAESNLPLSEANNRRIQSELGAEITFCKNSAQEDLRRASQRQAIKGEEKRQRIVQANLLGHDNESWGKAYAAVVNDPNLQAPALPQLDPSLALSYKHKYPSLDESPEQKKLRLKKETENKKLAESVRAERMAEHEAQEKAKIAAEARYLQVKAKWDKEWNDGYSAIISGQSFKSFDQAMKDLALRRSANEKAFFADKQNEDLLMAKYRIEARAKTYATSSSLVLYPSSGEREITPEYIAELSIRREAELRAIQVRLKAYGDYIDNKSSIAVPNNMTENQKYAFVMRYLDKLETETFEKEFQALKAKR